VGEKEMASENLHPIIDLQLVGWCFSHHMVMEKE
jgi:hypothetical protein